MNFKIYIMNDIIKVSLILETQKHINLKKNNLKNINIWNGNFITNPVYEMLNF